MWSMWVSAELLAQELTRSIDISAALYAFFVKAGESMNVEPLIVSIYKIYRNLPQLCQ